VCLCAYISTHVQAEQVFRFAHELRLLAGDRLQDVATRMGTTVDRIFATNYNRLTHFHNPDRPGTNAVCVCVCVCVYTRARACERKTESAQLLSSPFLPVR